MKNFRLAAKAFIVDDNKVLILKRRPNDVQAPGIWEPPGGRLEPGEDPKQGLQREVKEETDLDIKVLHPFNVRHFTRDDGQTITLVIFLSKAMTNKVKLSEEHTDFEWVPIGICKEKINEFFHEEVEIFNKLRLQDHV